MLIPGASLRFQVSGYMKSVGRELNGEEVPLGGQFPIQVAGGHAHSSRGKSQAPDP